MSTAQVLAIALCKIIKFAFTDKYSKHIVNNHACVNEGICGLNSLISLTWINTTEKSRLFRVSPDSCINGSYSRFNITPA